MSLRTRLIPLVDRCRAITGPSGLDQRVTQIVIRTRVWGDSRVGEGNKLDSDLVLPQQYHVKILGAKQVEQIIGSGGRYTPGQYVQFWVTPTYAGGGFSADDLAPKQTTGTEVIYILSSNGNASGIDGEYRRVAIHTDRPYRITVTLERSNRTP